MRDLLLRAGSGTLLVVAVVVGLLFHPNSLWPLDAGGLALGSLVLRLLRNPEASWREMKRHALLLAVLSLLTVPLLYFLLRFLDRLAD